MSKVGQAAKQEPKLTNTSSLEEWQSQFFGTQRKQEKQHLNLDLKKTTQRWKKKNFSAFIFKWNLKAEADDLQIK